MNHRALLMNGLAWLLVCLAGSQIKAAEAAAARPVDQAIIYFSFAPWDGAAYDIEIPLEHADDAVQPIIRVNIWGYPQFLEPKTIKFSGKEDAGGGPSRGDGLALFQAKLNKSMPERLVGSVSFETLQSDHPVSGSYEFATLDGKRKFKGSFQAAWGNKPAKVIRRHVLASGVTVAGPLALPSPAGDNAPWNAATLGILIPGAPTRSAGGASLSRSIPIKRSPN